MLQVSQLFVYPIKSMGGIALNKASVTDRGFEHDRRWMLIDSNNRFLSQRELIQMTLMTIEILEPGLKVSFTPKQSFFIIPFEPQTNEFVEVTVWEDNCTGQLVSAEADVWFSTMLNFDCRLVYMPDESRRITDQHYTPENSITSFADAFPFLIIGQASLNDLNNRVGQNLRMNRFRPNIVFTGGEPFAEDQMHTFTINGITFFGVKLCARCPIVTIDQETAEKGKEPLKTLSRYRFKNNKVMFGQNLVHEGLGEISIGDHIEVTKLNHEERFQVFA